MAFNIPTQWGAGKANPTSAALTWTRPSDWPVITDAPNEVQFLVSDAALLIYAIKTSFTRPGSENLYIDWGDGTVNTITTNTDTWTQHTYVQGAGTACSRGYTTWKVRVYTDPGCVITQSIVDANAGVSMPYAANVITNVTGVLEAYFGDGVQIATFGAYFTSSNRGVLFNYLEYVKFPSDCSYNTVDTSFFDGTFNATTNASAMNIGKVVMPVTTGSLGITYAGMFNSCYKLIEITLPATTNVINYSNTFANCRNLQSVTFPTSTGSHDSLTTTLNMFLNCYLLTSLVNMPPAFPAITSLSSMFSGCSSLNNIVIPRLGTTTGGSINTSNMFLTCSDLRSVLWAGDYTVGTPIKLDSASSMFSSCNNLQSLRFPEGIDLGNCTSIFSSCSSLKSVIFANSSVSISTFSSAFSSCFTLQEVQFPTSITVAVTFASAFTNCFSMEYVKLPEGGTITNLASTFSGCNSLKSVTLPASLANCTTISSTFTNCYSLQELVLPASMPVVTTMTAMVQNCTSLKSVTLPTTLTGLTTVATAFSTCSSLSGSITFPALPAITSFSNVFDGCRSLKSVTFSTVNAAVSTWGTAFRNCQALETLVLPSTQMTGVASSAAVSSTFQNCSSLKSITNIDKIGSTANTGLFDMSPTTNNTWAGIYNLATTISISPRLSRFACNGTSTTVNKVTGVRFLATATGQWTGTSPQINVSYTSMSTASIVTMFNDMAAQGNVTTKTVDITGSVGAAGLTAADRLIVTSKGWTITG